MTSNKPSGLSDSLVLFSSDDEESDSQYELKQYKNLTAMLKGVPPPSSITISKFTIEEILQKYHENKESFGFGLESAVIKENSKKPVPFLKYTNSSPISEVIASLSQKVQERYVQMETMSSWNAWFKDNLESYSSAKKRMGQNIGPSPSRRLSHLARRRQFFSSANLKRLANAENVRQIEIKRKVTRDDERRRICRNIESEKLKSSKRALFLSPEGGTPTKYRNSVTLDRRTYSSGSDEKKKLPLQEKSKQVEVMKWLSQQNFEVDFPRKRLREEYMNHSSERKRKCPRRSLNFTDDDVSSNVATSDSNNSSDKRTTVSGKLSEIHKNKLLWAISVVLRENKISRKDEHFKNLAAKLFFKCRTNLDEILTLNVAEGTSDKILHYARKILPSVLEKLGIESKFSSEANYTPGKTNVNSEFRVPDESKENINRNTIDKRDKRSNCLDGEVQFVFKTPRKIGKKRIVKSCQKASNSGKKKKKNFLRRWRSLEILIEEAVQSSMMNSKTDGAVTEEKGFLSAKNGTIEAEGSISSIQMKSNILVDKTEIMVSSDTSLLTSNVFENDCSVNAPTCVTPRLPSVDTSIIFSPVSGSVKEESENILYPSLCLSQHNHDESDIFCDENDSMEITNQDEELKKRIDSLEGGQTFPPECLMRCGGDILEKGIIPGIEETISCSETPIPLSRIENAQNLSEIRQLTNHSAVNVSVNKSTSISETHNDHTESEESHSIPAFSSICKSNTVEAVDSDDEEGENCLGFDAGRSTDESQTSNLMQSSKIEDQTYKPRKLIVKKSKPNWKVVRKNSEEADCESELRLKMRLSHEWEIVCRNSSCSDIGNNSECDSTSVNFSQISNTTDKEESSENEVENSSRGSSSQSKLDESIEEEATKSNLLFKKNDMLQINESRLKHGSDLSNREDDKSICSLIVQKAVSTESFQNDNSLGPGSVDNFAYCEESFDKTHEALCSTLKVDNDPDIDRVIDQEGCIVEEETGHRESVDVELGCKINCNSSDETVIKDTRVAIEQNDQNEEISFANEERARESSPSDLKKSSNEEPSKASNGENEREEVGNEDKSYVSSKRKRELEQVQFNSESSNMSASNGPERKKKFLSLENYKARKMEKFSNEVKSKVSVKESEPKDISPDEKTIERHKNKKIYHIRLKHPLGYRNNEQKNKGYSKERKENHSKTEGNREKLVSSEDLEYRKDESCNSDSRLQSLRQFLNNFCESNSLGNNILSDSIKWEMRNLDTAGPSDSNPNDVDVQTIVDALSALSNLVMRQIRLEDGKKTSQVGSDGNGLKRSKWLEVVLSWCGKNLKSLNQKLNSCSPSSRSSDGGNVVEKRFQLSSSSELFSNSGNFGCSNNVIDNRVDCREKYLKTNQEPVKGIMRSFSSVQTNSHTDAFFNNSNVTNTYINSDQNGITSNCIRALDSDSCNSQNFSAFSRETSLNTSEPFNDSAVKNCGLSRDSTEFNNDPEVNHKQFTTHQNNLKQLEKDPRRKLYYRSENQHLGGTFPDHRGEVSKCSESNELHLSYPSNYGELQDHYSSLQAQYQFSGSYLNQQLSIQKPLFYQPNLYVNCPTWEIPGYVSSLNYHQNLMTDVYQNSAFYTFQMPNIPYNFNKY